MIVLGKYRASCIIVAGFTDSWLYLHAHLTYFSKLIRGLPSCGSIKESPNSSQCLL